MAWEDVAGCVDHTGATNLVGAEVGTTRAAAADEGDYVGAVY